MLNPVVRGREASLRAALERFGPGPESPLARLRGVHFARWVVVPGLLGGDEAESTGPEHLLFTTTFDGAVEAHLTELCGVMAAEADAVWGNCDGYPGSGEPARFAAYMRRHRVRTSLLVSAYPHATLAQVRQALRDRERLRAFAPRAQGLGAAELQAAFEEAFPR